MDIKSYLCLYYWKVYTVSPQISEAEEPCWWNVSVWVRGWIPDACSVFAPTPFNSTFSSELSLETSASDVQQTGLGFYSSEPFIVWSWQRSFCDSVHPQCWSQTYYINLIKHQNDIPSFLSHKEIWGKQKILWEKHSEVYILCHPWDNLYRAYVQVFCILSCRSEWEQWNDNSRWEFLTLVWE